MFKYVDVAWIKNGTSTTSSEMSYLKTIELNSGKSCSSSISSPAIKTMKLTNSIPTIQKILDTIAATESA